jgi:hypothetical protein
MTATYLVLLLGDEREWSALDEAGRDALDASHREFTAVAPTRGHTIVEGRELALPSTALVVRRSRGGAPTVSEGPFAETVELVGGYYVVRTADPRDLARLVADTLTESADIRLMVGSEDATP